MPLKLFQSPRSPFFGVFSVTPFLNSTGIYSLPKISCRMPCGIRCLFLSCFLQCIKYSVPSWYHTILHFVNEFLISCSLIGPALISRSSSDWVILGSSNESGPMMFCLFSYLLLFLDSKSSMKNFTSVLWMSSKIRMSGLGLTMTGLLKTF